MTQVKKVQNIDELVIAANENFQKGDWDQAWNCCTQILKSQPQKEDALYLSGTIKMRQRQYNEAALFFLKATQANPHNVQNYQKAADAFYLGGNLEKAREYYGRALLLRPGDAELFNNHGFVSYELGDTPNAVESLQKAVFYEPENRKFKLGLIKALVNSTYNKYTAIGKAAITSCFEDNEISHQSLLFAWQSLLDVDPFFKPLHDCYDVKSVRQARKFLTPETMALCLADRYFALGLKRGFVINIKIEKALTFLRHILLEDIDKGETYTKTPETLFFLSCLAEQCWYNEYIFENREEEDKIVGEFAAALEKDFDGKNPADLARLLITACYMPLHKLPHAAGFSKKVRENGSSLGNDIVTLQIDEPLEELEIRKTIKSYGSINNEVSKKVRDQYENNPYPRWKAVDIYDNGKRYEGLDILIAGCGSGREIAFQLAEYRGADILGTDLSLTSLSYAKRQLDKIGFKDKYELLQGDILELGILGRKFDYICCSGVLHHMEDPLAGWKTLQSLLKPGGTLRIAVYSQHARRPISLVRDYIVKEGIKPTIKNIKDMRKYLKALPENNPMNSCTRWRDFFNLSECRDHLFHVQEHQFTLPRIKEVLEELNMEFKGFIFTTNERPLMYQRRFPDDPQAFNLDNWNKLEEENPGMFPDMYQLVTVNKA